MLQEMGSGHSFISGGTEALAGGCYNFASWSSAPGCMLSGWCARERKEPLIQQYGADGIYAPFAGKLVAKLNWRIPKANDDFIERDAVQYFKQVWLIGAEL